jgi:hypothetical protein
MRLLAFQLKEALVPAKSEGPYIITRSYWRYEKMP